MKIALVGYGKMGKIIDEIATKRGHEIVARLKETPTAENLNNPDVVIEFSLPEVAYKNIRACLENKIPVICGTTGWLEKKPEIEKLAVENETAFLYGSNFSLGVNLFFALNEKLADLMKMWMNTPASWKKFIMFIKKMLRAEPQFPLPKEFSSTIRNLMHGNWKKPKAVSWVFLPSVKMRFRVRTASSTEAKWMKSKSNIPPSAETVSHWERWLLRSGSEIKKEISR